MKRKISIDLGDLELDEVVAVARHGAKVQLAAEARRAVERTSRLIDAWMEENRTIYGVTTGFGALSDVPISREDARRLQINILMSHAAGVGPALD